MKNKLPSFENQFSEWYQEVIKEAEIADHAPVRGCIVIRPYGYSIWEHIKQILDQKIKETGHENAAFPLLIPESFLQKEAEHIEGFSPELAVVTHAGGKKLEEALVVRPTSETIVHYMFAQWLRSWRDLPLKVNQWASVIRWEMRPRAFIRTTEFWWQEGHTAHATVEEAEEEVRLMLSVYKEIIQNSLAIPVISGQKSDSEKFAGANMTLTIEGIMPDGKALQMGTSHLISQSFAHAFNMKYQNKDGGESFPFLTSWGVTTRLIGAIIMTHGDQKGLVLPPVIAPIQVIIIPINAHIQETRDKIFVFITTIEKMLQKENIRVKTDWDDQKKPGAKFNYWELKGVPLRMECGPHELENLAIVCSERIETEKYTLAVTDQLGMIIKQKLKEIQDKLFERALQRQQKLYLKNVSCDFLKWFENEKGYCKVGWCKKGICEEELKQSKLTIRCIPDEKFTEKYCFNCKEASLVDIIVAKAY